MSKTQIGLPDLRYRLELRGRAFGKKASFRDHVGVVAEREREVHVLLEQQDREPVVFKGF